MLFSSSSSRKRIVAEVVVALAIVSGVAYTLSDTVLPGKASSFVEVSKAAETPLNSNEVVVKEVKMEPQQATTTSTTSTTSYYYPAPTTTTWVQPSSSNPALFALLTLLAIPLLAALAVGIYCCMKAKPAAVAPPVQTYYQAAAPTYTYPAYTYQQAAAPTYTYQPAAYTYQAAAPTYSYAPAYPSGAEPVIVPVPVTSGGAYSVGPATPKTAATPTTMV